MTPDVLYLHGFASGPGSFKGVAFEQHLARRGVAVRRLDLRLPSLAHLRLSAMIEHVIAAIDERGPRARAILVGSSLGGLTAARVAERDPRVGALILLAPAFGFAARWRERLGDDGMAAWRRTNALRVHDHATGGEADVDFGFYEDAAAVDGEAGGETGGEAGGETGGETGGEAVDAYAAPDVRVPTWIFHGVHDEVVDVARSRAFAAGKPHVRLTQLDDGHELVASLPILLAGADRALAPWLGDAPG